MKTRKSPSLLAAPSLACITASIAFAGADKHFKMMDTDGVTCARNFRLRRGPSGPRLRFSIRGQTAFRRASLAAEEPSRRRGPGPHKPVVHSGSSGTPSTRTLHFLHRH